MGIRQRKEVTGQPWVYDYKDPATGKRKLATPKSGLRRDAIALKKKIDAEIESGVHVPVTDSASVEKIAQLFLEDLEQRRKDGRIGVYYEVLAKGIVKAHLIPHMGKKSLASVTIDDVIGLYNRMTASGLQPGTARDRIRAFARIEKFAIRRHFTKREVFRQALRELSGISKKPIQTFTVDDVRKLLSVSAIPRPGIRGASGQGQDQCIRNQSWLHLAVNLAAFCGLRWGEIFGLTLEAVDLENNVLRVRRSLKLLDAAGRYGLGHSTKTPAGQRDIPMPGHIRDLLRAWIVEFYIENVDKLVFTLGDDCRSGKRDVRWGALAGAPMRFNNFHDHWRRLLIAAGLRQPDARGHGLHFHALRHFASALMIEHHIPLTDVAGLMGHKNFDITLQIYAHSIVGGAKRHTAFENMAQSVNATNLQLLPASS